jgi:hydrogenase expression/formation protein HypE
MLIEEASLPVRDTVQGACEILGLDPLYVANEGKLVAVVPEEHSAAIVQAMQQHEFGRHARVIGEVVKAHAGMVRMKTLIGGTRILDLLFSEPLPRIC